MNNLKEESEEIFFAEVREPFDVRRNLLESLKDIVENLKRFEQFKTVREEKIENIIKLRTTIKEINKLASNLKASFPQTDLRAIKIEKKKAIKMPTRKKKKAKARKEEKIETEKPLSELEKLESELNAIESKLSALK